MTEQEKIKVLISFSGGKTSAYMTNFLLNNLSEKYEFMVVFANTGKEREETLQFVHDCDVNMGFNTIWVEAVTNPINGKGVTARVVNFYTASRNGEPFEAMIAKHGMPSTKSPHCTRELKKYAIRAFARQVGWVKYYTAIGIRIDEIDRMSTRKKQEKLMYPLITIKPTNKNDVNLFWSQQGFTLNLKSYEGNCDLCWKKSFLKLHTIINERPDLAGWWSDMEEKYSDFIPKTKSHNTKLKPPLLMYRGSTSIKTLIEEAKRDFVPASDDAPPEIREFKQNTLFDLEDYGCAESCEPF